MTNRVLQVLLSTAGPGAGEGTAPGGPRMTHYIVDFGDFPGAVTAAVASRRNGHGVILFSPAGFLGGMSASGLSATDFLGQRATIGGIASQLYDSVAARSKRRTNVTSADSSGPC